MDNLSENMLRKLAFETLKEAGPLGQTKFVHETLVWILGELKEYDDGVPVSLPAGQMRVLISSLGFALRRIDELEIRTKCLSSEAGEA